MISILLLSLTTLIPLTYFKHIAYSRIILLVIALILLNISTDISHSTTCFNEWVHNGNLTYYALALLMIASMMVLSIKDFNYKHKLNRIHHMFFLVFILLGNVCLITANDLLTLFVALELQSYAVYILTSSNRTESSQSAGLKYFLLGALSSTIIFLGITLVYIHTGSLSLPSLSDDLLGTSLILIGLCWKVASAPLHAWSIEVYDAVTTKMTSILALIPKISLLTTIIKLYSLGSNELVVVNNLMFIFIFSSLIIGSIGGLYQVKIRRLFAYSSTFNIGFILMLVPLDDGSSLFYMIQYILSTSLLFLVLQLISDKDLNNVIELRGLALYKTHWTEKLNWTAIAVVLTIIIFSIAGVPPFIGFIAKLNLFIAYGDINTSSLIYYITIALTSVIAMFYYLILIQLLWFKPSTVNYYTYSKLARRHFSGFTGDITLLSTSIVSLGTILLISSPYICYIVSI